MVNGGFSLTEMFVGVTVVVVVMGLISIGLSSARDARAEERAEHRHEAATQTPPAPAGPVKSLVEVLAATLAKKKAELQAINESPRGRTPEQIKRSSELVDDIATLLAAQKEAAQAAAAAKSAAVAPKAEKK